MRINNLFLMKLGGLGIATLTRSWMSTLSYRVVYYDASVDPASPLFRGPGIFLFWHEYIPFLFYLRGHCHIAMLLSRHQDAEWLSQATRHMGFDTVRGSTNRGGVAALRELMRASRTLNLTMTPDGPRGPRRRLAPGCIYLASRLGIPLIPIGLGYDRPWRWRQAWDQFAVPRPYSRARAVVGPKLYLPSDLDRTGVERYRQQVEEMLNTMTDAAERWATSHGSYIGEQPLFRQGRPRYHEMWRPDTSVYRCDVPEVQQTPTERVA